MQFQEKEKRKIPNDVTFHGFLFILSGRLVFLLMCSMSTLELQKCHTWASFGLPGRTWSVLHAQSSVSKCQWVICSVPWRAAESASAPPNQPEPWRSLTVITISTTTTPFKRKKKRKKERKVWLKTRKKVFPDSCGDASCVNAWTHPPCVLFISACFISLSHLTCDKCWFSSHTGTMDKASP